MTPNPAVTSEERNELEMETVAEERNQLEMETVAEERNEMDMEMVPERYMDIITREFAYDPVRLPLEQDPTQLLYNRNTLQIIWETTHHARNPYTRQWFNVKNVIPQTKLRKKMKHYIKLHRFPSNTVIAEYSKVLEKEEMKGHLMKLRKSIKGGPIMEKQWVNIWKKMNLIRLFCELHSQNIETFISVHGFRYLNKLIEKILTEKEAREAALDVGKEIVRSINVIISGVKSPGEKSMAIIGKSGKGSKARIMILNLISILGHVYKCNEGYLKMQSFILRAFSTISDEIQPDTNIALINGNANRDMLDGYSCALHIFCQTNAIDISSEDLNHGIAILGRARASQLNFKRMYSRAVSNALIICISRENERPNNNNMSVAEALEAQEQARHNSEALEKAVRLLKDIVLGEGQLADCLLRQGLNIVKEVVHMFERFRKNENEDEVDEEKISIPICEKRCEIGHCVHYRIAQDALDIAEVIRRRRQAVLDVEVLHKFIRDRTEN